ncbi:MAG: hypothetical protein FJ116_12160 [Deltaproteobacteria bacterium]|nr:hypothetical protein [Deltaproteobacteria bacterium]
MKIAFKPLALIPPLVLATLVNPHVLAYRASTTSVSNNKTEVSTRPPVRAFSIVALPKAAPRSDRLVQSPVPFQLSFAKVFVLTAGDQEVIEKISRFVSGIDEVAPKNQSYKGQTSSGKLLLSLKILAYVLKNGPTPEYQALGIPMSESSNISNPEEKLTISSALALATADWNSLSKQIYVEQPELLESPTPFLVFVRKNLLYLNSAQKKFCSSGSC